MYVCESSPPRSFKSDVLFVLRSQSVAVAIEKNAASSRSSSHEPTIMDHLAALAVWFKHRIDST